MSAASPSPLPASRLTLNADLSHKERGGAAQGERWGRITFSVMAVLGLDPRLGLATHVFSAPPNA
jgi:hypothetical protein